MLVFLTIMIQGHDMVQAQSNDTYFAVQKVNVEDGDYVVLQKNKSFAEQITKPNTTYEIRFNYDLNGATVELPDNAVLLFAGGAGGLGAGAAFWPGIEALFCTGGGGITMPLPLGNRGALLILPSFNIFS